MNLIWIHGHKVPLELKAYALEESLQTLYGFHVRIKYGFYFAYVPTPTLDET